MGDKISCHTYSVIITNGGCNDADWMATKENMGGRSCIIKKYGKIFYFSAI
jgi:hypothetical protein